MSEDTFTDNECSRRPLLYRLGRAACQDGDDQKGSFNVGEKALVSQPVSVVGSVQTVTTAPPSVSRPISDDDDDEADGATEVSISTSSNKNRCQFLQNLMNLLDGKVAPDALWWIEGTNCLALQPQLFGTQILDKHFRGSKFASFARKLYKFGFRRVSRGLRPKLKLPKKTVVFFHESFKRASPHLLHTIREDGKSKSKAKGGNNEEGSQTVQFKIPTTQLSQGSVTSTIIPQHQAQDFNVQHISNNPAVGLDTLALLCGFPLVSHGAHGPPLAPFGTVPLMHSLNAKTERLREMSVLEASKSLTLGSFPLNPNTTMNPLERLGLAWLRKSALSGEEIRSALELVPQSTGGHSSGTTRSILRIPPSA